MKQENLTNRKKIGNEDAFVLLFGAVFFCCCFARLGFFWSRRSEINSRLKITFQEYSREGKVGTYLVSTFYYVVDDGAIIELLF